MHLVFRCDQEGGAVFFTELRFFNLAGGVPGNFRKDDFAGAFVAGKLSAIAVDLLFRAGKAFFDLDDGCGDLAQALVGQADDCDVVDGLEGMEEVFNLDGVDVFTACDDDVLFAVYEILETILVLHSHVAGVEPALVVQDFF